MEDTTQTELTLAELKAKRDVATKEVDEKQEQISKETYTVDFEKLANIKAVLKQIDKSYKWNLKNAALIVRLYDTLNAHKIEMQKETTDDAVVELNGLDLNTLYKVLTSIEGTGIEAAKTFTKLLTNVGKQITDAMSVMQESNKEVQKLHTELAELDKAIAKKEKKDTAAKDGYYTSEGKSLEE